MAEYSNRNRSKLFRSGLVDVADIKDGAITLDKLAPETISEYANKTYVDDAISGLIDSAPGVLDTLNEIAAAIGDDANFITTINNSIDLKLASADFDTTFDTRLALKDTDDLTEGTNLYYTDARARASISASGSLSYDSETGEMSFTLPTLTTNIVEEGDNLYYTDERVRAAISGSGGITYTSSTGEFILSDSGVTADTYGSASLVPVLTVDALGRITSATTVSVAGVSNFTYDSLTNTYTISTADGGSFAVSGDLGAFTTDNLTEGSTNLYYTSTRANTDFDDRLALKTTDDLTEGSTNLYYTEARWDAKMSAADTDDLAEGTNLYYTEARVDANIALKTTDDITEGSTNLYYTSTRANTDFDNRLAIKTTDDLTEGTNLYYTEARVDANIALKSTDDITEGITNLYYTESRVDANIALKSTDDITEGVTNLYYTEARVDSNFATKDTDDLTEGSANLYYTDLRAQTAITVDATLSKTGGQISMPASGVTAGSYGSASAVPVITVDNQGRITSATTTPVAGVSNVSYDDATGILTISTSSGTDYDVDLNVGSNDSPTFNSVSTQYTDYTPIAAAGAPAYQEGRLYYSSDSKTLSLYSANSDFPITIGEREWVRCRNNSGATITKGTPVYVTGVHISGDPIHGHHPTIAPADASDSLKYNVIGLAGQDIANGSHGYVVVRGWIQGIDTSNLTEGTRVHLGFAAPGTLIDEAPSYPNYPTDVGICLTSDATVGAIYVDVAQHSFEGLRVSGNARIGNNLTVGGDLVVLGSTTTANSNSIAIGSPFNYLNSGDTIGESNTVFTGSGLNDAYFAGYFKGSSTETYYVAIDGVGTGTGGVDTFKWSYNSDMSSPQATAVDIIANTDIAIDAADGIYIHFESDIGHTLNDKWAGTASPINVDTGWASNRNTGTTGVGYTHLGMFFDVSTEKFRLFDTYDPEPEGTINISDASFHTATLIANLEGNVTGTLTGNITGNAATATTAGKWSSARTITLGGDLTGNVSIDGSANVTLTATVAANSVALGTDTTGNYMVNVSGGTGISVSHTQGEGSTATITNSGVTSLVAGNAITVSGATGTVTVNHADTSSVANLSSDNSGNTFIQDIALTFDTYGHVTAATVATGTVSIGDAILTLAAGNAITLGNTSGANTFSANSTTANTITVNHADTSSVANLSSDNSNGVVLQDIALTFDTYGHVTGATAATVDLDGRYWRNNIGTLNVNATVDGSGSNPFDDAHIETRVTGSGSYLLSYTGASAHMISSYVGGSASVFQMGAHYSGNDFYMRTRTDSTTWQPWRKLFHENYHPNADKWTTARINTVTLTGDVTGTAGVSVDGSANWTVSVDTTVVNDSHTHAFNNLTDKTGGTGDYTTTGKFTAATFNATSTTDGGFQGIDADTAGSPSFTWTSDLNTGIWHAAADSIGFATNGTNRLTVSTTAVTSSLAVTAPVYYNSGTTYYMQPATALSSTTAGSRFNDVRFNTLWQGVPAAGGPILTYTLTSGGTGYTDGSYTNLVVSGGQGVYATFDFTVVGGIVTVATLTERGSGFQVGNTLTIPVLGGTGSGGVITVDTVRTVDVSLYNAASRIRLGSNDTSLAAGQEIGGIYFNARDASAGGAGDKAYILGVAEGTSGGGQIQFWTSSNGGAPTLCAVVGGANDFRLYNTAGTFYHAFSNAPTANRTLTLPDETGTVALTTSNVSTATTLQTARTINGTSFNGSANITTANWGTARTLTIGATGKSVNGSANVAWTATEILGYAPPKYTESATPPASPNNGDEWWYTTGGALYKRIENSWVQLSPASGISIFDVNGTKVN